MPESVEVPQPPQPSEFRRRIVWTRLQAVGMPLLAAVPLLALFGAFGVSRDGSTASGEELVLEVEYPSRTRLLRSDEVVVRLTNRGRNQLDIVTVSVERSYLDGFSDVTFTPSAERISEDAYEVSIERLAAGETRLLTIELRAQDYWTRSGEVRAATAEEELSARLATFVFP